MPESPRFSDRFSLRLALVLFVIVPLAGSLASTGYLALNKIERQVERRLQKDLELVARAIQLPLSHALERERTGSISSALQSAFSIGRVYSAYVYDQKGRLITSAGRSASDTRRDKLTELAADGRNTGEYGRVGDRGVYSSFIPLADSGGRVSGLLHLTRRQSDFRKDIQGIRRQGTIGLSIGVLVMTGLVLLGHHHALGRHFKRLTDGMAQISAGRRSYRIPALGPKEMVEVAKSFNQMLDSIAASEQALQRKRIEKQKLEHQLRHKEKLAAIGHLAAGVAHELGTPLSVIRGRAQRALRKKDLAPELTADLDHVIRQVTRMSDIVRQLLDFSRPDQMRLKPIDPAQIARSAVAAVSHQVPDLAARIEISPMHDLPQLTADPVRLEQALVNLLCNALQAGDKTTVRFSCEQKDRWVSFKIEDDGPGIPDHLRARVFEPFFTTKPVGAGTGLGLAVVHGIIEEHGGRIDLVDSNLGGAAFGIWLPLHADRQ